MNNNIIRRIFAVLVIVSMLVATPYVTNAQDDDKTQQSFKLTETDFAKKVKNLQSIYRDGQYWNGYNVNGCESTGPIICPECKNRGYCRPGCSDNCGYFEGAWQCWGFANKMGNLIFGTTPDLGSWGTATGWEKTSSVKEYFAGDLCRINNDNHSIFIFEIKGDIIRYVDCNNSGPCQVEWDNYIKKSDLDKKITYVCHYKGNTLKGTEVSEVILGDINWDGKIDSIDAVTLLQYLAGYSVVLPDESAADVTGDGKINAADAVLLKQYLAGMDVEFVKYEEMK